MVAPPSGSHFGRMVPGKLADTNDFVSLGDRALVKWDDDIRVCVSVVDSEVDARRERLRDDTADIRMLGDFRDEDGRRSMLFDQPVLLLREFDVPGWHFHGPRVVKEL